jgi:hypothetical protein
MYVAPDSTNIFGLYAVTACRITYHHEYQVKDGVRTYYDATPEVLQIGNHQFVECRLVHLWRTDMGIAWKSATNCA